MTSVFVQHGGNSSIVLSFILSVSDFFSSRKQRVFAHFEFVNMTLMVFFGCAFIAFGPAFALFSLTVAKDAQQVIVLIAR